MIKNLKNLLIKVICLALSFSFFIPTCFFSFAAEDEYPDYGEVAATCAEKCFDTDSESFFLNAGSSASDWEAFALLRLGIFGRGTDYVAALSRYIEKKYENEGTLDKNRATEYHRIALVIEAAGFDSRGVYTFESDKQYDLIDDGVYNREKTAPIDKQGINGTAWGLILLGANDRVMSGDCEDDETSLIEKLIAAQMPDGGFSLDYTLPDPDVTAMVLTALSRYKDDKTLYRTERVSDGVKIEKSVEDVIDSALGWLSAVQNENGSFDLRGIENCESTAQVIIALTSLGIDPASDFRFIKNESAISALLSFKTGAGFTHSFSEADNESGAAEGEISRMATRQAVLAFTALDRREKGLAPLYDLRDTATTANPVSEENTIEKPYDYGDYIAALSDAFVRSRNGEDYSKSKDIISEIESDIERAKETDKRIAENFSGDFTPDAELLNGIKSDMDSLCPAARGYIINGELLRRAEEKLKTGNRNRVIYTVLSCALVAVLLTVALRVVYIRKKKKEKKDF